MSKATKRKHVMKEVIDSYILPTEDLQVVKIVSSKGNNLHEVEASDGSHYLASMPTKFRKNVWIKRGDFVMIREIEEGDKVKAEIEHILYKPQIAYIRQQGLWPQVFDSSEKSDSTTNMIPDDMLPPSGSEDSDSDRDTDGEDIELNFNPNRAMHVTFKKNQEEDSDDSDEEEEEEENFER